MKRAGCLVRGWLLLAVLMLGGPAAIAAEDEEVREHAVNELPAVVMKTARKAGPDVFFTSARSYWKDDFRVYRVSGRLFREVWNVYVREDGKLLRTETDNQEE